MKVIRRPLTTLDDKDFMTWEKVNKKEENEQLAYKQFKAFLKIRERIRATEKNGKVFVDGLGWVAAF